MQALQEGFFAFFAFLQCVFLATRDAARVSHTCVAPAQPHASATNVQSVLPRKRAPDGVEQVASSASEVMDPALQHGRPVDRDQPKPLWGTGVRHHRQISQKGIDCLGQLGDIDWLPSSGGWWCGHGELQLYPNFVHTGVSGLRS